MTSMHPSTTYPLRGVIIARLARALRDLGHRIDVVEIGSDQGFGRYISARRRVSQAVADLHPDLMHVHFGYSGVAVPRCSIPIITSFYGDDLNGTVTPSGSLTLKSLLGILVGQWMASRSARCIAVSAHLRDRLWLRDHRKKTAVIRDAVDLNLFRPMSRSHARERLGIAQHDQLIIFPHDVKQATKRFWLARRTLDLLTASIPSARLWVVNGRPPDEMPWYYAAADAMIVTSEREGGPSSVKEALACGIPVVSVAVGDTELFDEVPTWLVRADASPEALSAALREVLGRRNAAERCSHLPPGLTLDRAAEAISKLYEDVTRSRRTA